MRAPISHGTIALGKGGLANPELLFDMIERGLRRRRPHSLSRVGTTIVLRRWPGFLRGLSNSLGGISEAKVTLASSALTFELEHEGAVFNGFVGACAGTIAALALRSEGRVSVLEAVGLPIGAAIGLAIVVYLGDVLAFRSFLAACITRVLTVPPNKRQEPPRS